MEYGQYTPYHNAVSTFASSQDWADVAAKIADSTYSIDYIIDRMGCSGPGGADTTSFVITKLEQQVPNIKNLIDRSRVKKAIRKLKESLNVCAPHLVEGYKENCLRDQTGKCITNISTGAAGTSNNVLDIIGQLFNPKPDGTQISTDQLNNVYTTTGKKNYTALYWGLGITAAAIFVVGTIVIAKKASK